MTGYVRQQAYFDGDTILAEHTNDEFNLLETAFSATVGHKHDGSTGSGGYIGTLSDSDNDTKITVEETVDADEMHFYAQGSKKMTIDSAGLLIGDRFRLSYNPVLDSLDIGVE